MKILVFGGTNFFGKKAVQRLLDNEHEVTIATRGLKSHTFQGKVGHITLDVKDESHAGWEEVKAQEWDAVFNNICYTKEEAELMMRQLTGITKRLYVTSSMAVYSGEKDGYVEEDFDPTRYVIDPNKEVNYGEGKRQVEVALASQDEFEWTAFRFPIVLDDDDYTKRLHHYVELALNEEPIEIYSPIAKVNYVKGSIAAESIVWAIENLKSGIYNVGSTGPVEFQQMLEWILEATDIDLEVMIKPEIEYAPLSPRYHQYVVPDKVQADGFVVNALESWMPELIQRIADEMSA